HRMLDNRNAARVRGDEQLRIEQYSTRERASDRAQKAHRENFRLPDDVAYRQTGRAADHRVEPTRGPGCAALDAASAREASHRPPLVDGAGPLPCDGPQIVEAPQRCGASGNDPTHMRDLR